MAAVVHNGQNDAEHRKSERQHEKQRIPAILCADEEVRRIEREPHRVVDDCLAHKARFVDWVQRIAFQETENGFSEAAVKARRGAGIFAGIN